MSVRIFDMAFLKQPTPTRPATAAGQAGEIDPLAALVAEERVRPCLWQGQPAFVKRLAPRRAWERWLLALFAPLLRRLCCPDQPFVPVVRKDRRLLEVERLRELEAAGVDVPEVLGMSPGAFVMASVGPSLEAAVREAPPETRRGPLLKAAEDLAAFHARGQWHGGAQIRNLAPHGKAIARFDFDREFDRYLPLALLQALDAILFLSSIGSLVSPSLAAAVAESYCACGGAPVLAILSRLVPWALRLGKSPGLRRIAGKEGERLQVVAHALGAALRTRSRTGHADGHGHGHGHG